jgi:hypothetical protein
MMRRKEDLSTDKSVLFRKRNSAWHVWTQRGTRGAENRIAPSNHSNVQSYCFALAVFEKAALPLPASVGNDDNDPVPEDLPDIGSTPTAAVGGGQRLLANFPRNP